MNNSLIVDDLHVHFSKPNGTVIKALNGVSLQLGEGTMLGILGESGSGKSTLAKVLLRLLPKNSQIVRGLLSFEGRNLRQLTEREINEIRGVRMAMISQEPGLALNPVMKVGDQIAEVLHAHRKWSSRQCRSEAEALLDRVNLRSTERRVYHAYPHQLSGGQQQRVAIAQALACNPSLIIADEPTASLDSTTEIEILDIFRQLKNERKTSLLLITHDPAILPGIADRVAVFYAGRIVENAPTDRIFETPMHPYVKALFSCMRAPLVQRSRGYRFTTISGNPPNAEALTEGCSFSPRCAERMTKCGNARPSTQEMDEESCVECFLYDR